MKRFVIPLILMTVISETSLSQNKNQIDTLFLEKLLHDNPLLFADILKHPTNNEIQILYTRIDRDEKNIPHFRSYGYHLDPSRYFYPASTVKLPASIFALEKINALKIRGLAKETAMLTGSDFTG